MTTTPGAGKQLLVIDDEQERLDALTAALRDELGDDAGNVVVEWLPRSGEDPYERFHQYLTDELVLIATDQDLLKTGAGLLGSTITTWAQDKFLPVCNFSRQPRRPLPRERNFFELRVPREGDERSRAKFIARMFHGFSSLRAHVASTDDPRPTAALLAEAMGYPELQDDLAPFLSSVASANSSFRQVLLSVETPLEGLDRTNFLTFLSGHVLVNAVLEFPGPILSLPVLCAYCAVGVEAAERLAELFAAAEYSGPFAASGMYFLQRLVESRVDELAAELDDAPIEVDAYNRAAIEKRLGALLRHDCPRCHGDRGGLWCPFTNHAVCNRSDCSVASTAWIPRGATLCRVEKTYFDDWAPLLGE
jgi:hypothetical protein